MDKEQGKPTFDRRSFIGLGALAAGAAAASLAGCTPQDTGGNAGTTSGGQTTATAPVIPAADETLEFDVVVCGSGMAGMTAALEAAYQGANVALIEKMGVLGGGTNFAEGIFACGSPLQKERGIKATVKDILKTEYDFQHFIVDTKLWEVIAHNSAEDIAWLMDQGVEFIDLFNTGGGEYTHHIYMDFRGKTAITAMEAKANELGVSIFTNTAAQHLLMEGNAVVGVQADQDGKIVYLKAKGGVILATGSAGSNFDLLEKYSIRTPEKTMYNGAPGVEGDGINMAMEIGMGDCFRLMGPWIGLVVEPLGFNSHLSAAGAMEPTNVWVNQNGERFANEGLVVFYTYPNNCVESQVRAYSVLDQAQMDRMVNEGCIMGWAMYIFAGTKLTEAPAEMDRMLAEGNENCFKAETIEDLAQQMGLPVENLSKTISDYNGYAKAGTDEQYGKDPQFLAPVSTPPYYGFRIKQNCINMYGGIHVNPNNEVIKQDATVIPGLYAAGSECGGYQGETYGLALPGSCQGVSLGTGRVAARNASARAKG